MFILQKKNYDFLRLTESKTHYPTEGTIAQIAFLEGLPTVSLAPKTVVGTELSAQQTCGMKKKKTELIFSFKRSGSS